MTPWRARSVRRAARESIQRATSPAARADLARVAAEYGRRSWPWRKR